MGCMIFLLCLVTPAMDLTTRIFLHDLYFLQLYLSKITQPRNQQQKVLNRKKKKKGYLSLFLQLAFPLVG